MTDFERADAFEEELRARCASRTVATRYGPAFFHDELPRVRTLNLLRVDDHGGASVSDLAAEAERVQSGSALRHRRILVPTAAVGEARSHGFRELGWSPDRLLFMADRGERARRVDASVVQEVDGWALAGFREDNVRWEPWGREEETVRQVAAAGRLFAAAGRGRHFAVLADGEVVAATDLYSDGRTAQIEHVVTHPDHRGRGHASALILRALEEAAANRHDLVFLTTDALDWPSKLYRRLGFVPIGETWAFHRRVK